MESVIASGTRDSAAPRPIVPAHADHFVARQRSNCGQDVQRLCDGAKTRETLEQGRRSECKGYDGHGG